MFEMRHQTIANLYQKILSLNITLHFFEFTIESVHKSIFHGIVKYVGSILDAEEICWKTSGTQGM